MSGRPLRKRARRQYTEIELELVRLAELERACKGAKADYTEQAQRVMKLVARRSDPVVLPDGTSYQVTKVTPQQSRLNLDKLKRRLGAARFRRMHTLQFDETKLQAAIKAGDVSAVTVAACMEVTDGTSYLRSTRR